MDKINFCKFHGFGNDYIVVEKDELKNVSDIGEFTKKICHRNTGVGGDGIALLEKLDGIEADYSCRIINPRRKRSRIFGQWNTLCGRVSLLQRFVVGQTFQTQNKKRN